MNYPKDRKPKLSAPEDAIWYPQTYLKIDSKGKRRRYLKGPCGACGEEHEILWGNFRKIHYRFLHLRCGQNAWNKVQGVVAKETSKETIAGRVMRHCQHGATARGLSFNLSLEQFITIAEQPCEYCGVAPSMRRTEMSAERDRETPIFLHNGIDRRDNEIGYEPDNCAPCCTQCNFLKRNTPYEEWLAFLGRVTRHHSGR